MHGQRSLEFGIVTGRVGGSAQDCRKADTIAVVVPCQMELGTVGRVFSLSKIKMRLGF
jgi:hypothetical protein